MSNRRQIRSGISGTLLVALILGLAVPIISVPAYWILFHTGSWWLPLFFSYLSLFSIAAAFFINRKVRTQEHATVGDEMYYRNYPEELRRQLRALRKQGLPETLSQKVEQYRAWPVPTPRGEEAEREEQKYARGKTLFLVFGSLCALIACFLLWGVLQDMGTNAIRVPEILILLAVALLIAEAVCAFMRKSIPLLHIIAALIQGFGAWARMILILEYNVGLMDSRLIESAVCLLLFLIGACILSPAADRNIRESKTLQTDWELYLGLFEIGSISEEDLKYELQKRQGTVL